MRTRSPQPRPTPPANSANSGAKTITVDTTAPVVTLTTVNGTARTFPYTTNATVTTVGGACGSTRSGDPATVTVAITGASTQSGTATCTRGVWTFTPTTALSANGTYTITATQTDTATNTGTSGAQSITINTAAPIVTFTTVNGTARTFPFTTNATVTTVGGTCTTAAGVNPTVSVAILGASTQNGTAACTTGALDVHAHDGPVDRRRVRDHRNAERHREQRRYLAVPSRSSSTRRSRWSRSRP